MRSDFEITGAHAQWFWDYWCTCALILRLLVRMRSDFEITGAHTQWFWYHSWEMSWRYTIHKHMCLRLLEILGSSWFELPGTKAKWLRMPVVSLSFQVRLRSDFEITGTHSQWFWDYWCTCAVILRLLVRMHSDFDNRCACAVILRFFARMRSDLEISGAHAQWFLDCWCACAVLFRLLCACAVFWYYCFAHAQWVLDPPGGSSFRSNFSRPLAIKSKSPLSPSPHTLCGEEFTPFPQLIISSHLFPALYLLHTRHHSSLLKSSLYDMSQELSNFSAVLSLLDLQLVVHSMYHRVDRMQGFFSSRLIGTPPPHPLTRRRVCPPFGSGRGHTRLWEWGWGIPIPTRGQTLWHSMYICTLWYALYSPVPGVFNKFRR